MHGFPWRTREGPGLARVGLPGFDRQGLARRQAPGCAQVLVKPNAAPQWIFGRGLRDEHPGATPRECQTGLGKFGQRPAHSVTVHAKPAGQVRLCRKLVTRRIAAFGDIGAQRVMDGFPDGGSVRRHVTKTSRWMACATRVSRSNDLSSCIVTYTNPQGV